MVQCQLKLKLRPTQERLLNRWLWHLTGVYNWAIRKIELDANDGRFYSSWSLESLLKGSGPKVGVPRDVIAGTVRTAHMAWKRRFSGLGGRPHLKGERNRLNSILFKQGVNWIVGRKVRLTGFGVVRFHDQNIPTGRIGYARLVRRASGWYLCLWIQTDRAGIISGDGEVGIDPGFAHLATLSSGEQIEHPDELRAGAARLGQAQRGRRRWLTARLLERQGNRRKDRNHKLSLRLVKQNGLIAWSKDRSANLAKTFGKSVSSAGHYQLRSMLDYKCRAGGSRFIAVPSRNSTRTCSSCGALSGPTGWAGLSVRHWVCAICGVEHDRDCNAAVNTLNAARGMRVERGREAASGIVATCKTTKFIDAPKEP